MGEAARRRVAECKCEDGGLFDQGWYIGWTPGRDYAVLDGEFTASELRAIAEWMESRPRPIPTA